ncbi:hypothetical protein LWI28_011204 [Acer negundo]|uniref:Transmembrane protein n=1 Tax=Acer negundo TaxID=4023 RepID=A0AAD5IV16_ACENE|nr:hypothetical protein LWI28_011204 [Acer negundo]KAK4845604.1 hypothetical protein QYF36_007009 [Acer negundo]
MVVLEIEVVALCGCDLRVLAACGCDLEVMVDDLRFQFGLGSIWFQIWIFGGLLYGGGGWIFEVVMGGSRLGLDLWVVIGGSQWWPNFEGGDGLFTIWFGSGFGFDGDGGFGC